MYFLDASALAKAYLDEDGTPTVKGILEYGAGWLFISDFVALEVLTSIRIALRTATRTQFQTARDKFRVDYPKRFMLVDVDPETRAAAMEPHPEVSGRACPQHGRAAPGDRAAPPVRPPGQRSHDGYL